LEGCVAAWPWKRIGAGDEVSASDRSKLEAQMNTLKETMPGEDAGRIRVQIAELQQAMMVLCQATYSDRAGRPWA
jgi:hypothetical protein